MFVVTQFVYQGSQLLGDANGDFHVVVQWAIAVTRATLWYGFLAALIGAQLYAGRVLRRIVEASLERPSFAELEAMLRAPVGDPGLRLLFWRPRNLAWSDAHGTRVAGPEPRPGQVVTAVDLRGAPAIAIVHDRELAEDPELVHAAGTVALLARENAELEAAWDDSRRVLRESRSRIAAARDHERRALERDLHDSVQQHMTAIVLRLAMVREMIDAGSPAYDELETLEVDLQETLNELRRLAHGIYPGVARRARADRRVDRGGVAATGEGLDPGRRPSAGSRRQSSRRSTTAASRRCRTPPSTRGRTRASRSA